AAAAVAVGVRAERVVEPEVATFVQQIAIDRAKHRCPLCLRLASDPDEPAPSSRVEMTEHAAHRIVGLELVERPGRALTEVRVLVRARGWVVLLVHLEPEILE